MELGGWIGPLQHDVYDMDDLAREAASTRKEDTQKQGTPYKATQGRIQIQSIGSTASQIQIGKPLDLGIIPRVVRGFPPYLPRCPSLAKTFTLQHMSSSPVTRGADPALPTGTQGDQVQHRSRIIGGPPPLVGVRAKLGSWIQQSRRFC
ncbi:unnamed protein product [Phytophthora fragariaefolia]|uniref:Unnamed protein product n=1 Tax=Phytophthora fragariaefolia TaxID=1490495 RepID=A0A9W7D3B0_9STRA|nr:unnamed protein product [Phytophthora fragariaefolia]